MFMEHRLGVAVQVIYNKSTTKSCILKPLDQRKTQAEHSDINRSNIHFNPSPRVMEIKTKINKQNLIKLKSFCTAKETTNKTKRQPTEWEKIFANEATDRGLVSKIYKQLMWLNTQKTKTQSKKQADNLNRHVSKEDIQMAKRHVKRWSASLLERC